MEWFKPSFGKMVFEFESNISTLSQFENSISYPKGVQPWFMRTRFEYFLRKKEKIKMSCLLIMNKIRKVQDIKKKAL